MVYGSGYNDCSNYYNRSNNIPTQQEYRRIGYTTNYSNGNFNSSVYQTNSNFGYTTLHRNNYTTVHTYSGTYQPGNTSRPGGSGPRRITVYDGNDNSRETPGGDRDPEGVYQYDETTGIWYYSPDEGQTWYEYRRASGFWEMFIGLFGGGWGNDWRSVSHEPTENTEKWASDPDDPFLTPVGEFPIGLLLMLMFIYILYRNRTYRNEKT